MNELIPGSQLVWILVMGEHLEHSVQWALINRLALQPHGDNKHTGL